MRKLLSTMLAAVVLALPGTAFAAPGGSGGVTGPAFYVDGVLYRTVATPTDLSGTGAPAHSFDTIYDISAYQGHNVATAAPGDRDYNGGRWMVHKLTFTNYAAAIADPLVDLNASGDIDSAEEIDAAVDQGYIASDTVVKSFVCPVIPDRRGH